MKRRWAALVVVPALGAVVPTLAAAQGTQSAPPGSTEHSPAVQVGQNYPNPFNSATVIPFTIGDPPTCTKDGGRLHHVTLRIYNVLAQLVAIPVLQAAPTAGDRSMVNVTLACGSYTAFWNGNYMNTSREVPSGVYIYLIEVDGRSLGKKMLLIR